MPNTETTRRDFLASLPSAAGVLRGAHAKRSAKGSRSRIDETPDVTIHIAPVQLEIAKGRIINTIGYNGSVPGPLIRLREGAPVTVEISNATGTPEYMHWHGLEIEAALDGAEEEKSLVVPANGRLRYRLTPAPSGSRYVHTHTMPMSDLNRGVFTGQFAFSYIEPRTNPGRYDQEVFLATHEWEPYLTPSEVPEDASEAHLQAAPHVPEEGGRHGLEVAYRYFTINGRCLGWGDPLRVKEGQRVLFHFLNASATESVRFALPGHRFQVVALDGNPVPRPQSVDVIELGTAERIDAVVEMNAPGVWILGTPKDIHRAKGMGIVVEYANRDGKPRWIPPAAHPWDYTIFGGNRPQPKPDEILPIVFGRIKPGKDGFERWTLNGKSYDPTEQPHPLAQGKHYRLIFDNQTDDAHPVHLHRHSFELVNVHGMPTSGVIKDVVVVKSFNKIAVDLTPRGQGLMLFHCHQQLHMDYGFRMLFNVV
jgi:FtsP/CotA-like multicopper oxidase with cupredoxin domain